MTLSFHPIQIEHDFAYCLAFRKDSYQCSFGTLEGYEESITNYQSKIRQRMLNDPLWRYLHIYSGEQIIGQLEFRHMHEQPGHGYIHLFYLRPEYRGQGLSQHLHDYVRSQLVAMGCQSAYLSVSRTNKRALAFYRRHGWHYLKRNAKHPLTDFYQCHFY